MMPELDGYEVLKSLSLNPSTSTIPFIFLTAKAEKAERKLGLDLGADDYLVKPFNIPDLIRSIESCLQKKHDLVKQYEDDWDELNDIISLRRNELIDWLTEDY